MLHEKVGEHGTRNGGRYQVAQSWLNRLHYPSFREKSQLLYGEYLTMIKKN